MSSSDNDDDDSNLTTSSQTISMRAETPVTQMTFKELELEFAKITDRIKYALCLEKVKVHTLIEKLSATTAVEDRRVPLFDQDVFDKLNTIDDLWEKLKHYWTLYDYDILIYVVELTECKKAEIILDNFLSKMKPLALENVDLVLVYDKFKEKQVKPLLGIKINVKYCTLEMENDFKKTVSEIFQLKKCTLYCVVAVDGCIELFYRISNAMAAYLLQYKITGCNMAVFTAVDIIHLQIDDMMLIVPFEITNKVSMHS